MNEITATVRLLPATEGGRQGPVTTEFLACIFELEGELFDCRIYPPDLPLRAGVPSRVTIRFLRPELVVPRLTTGDRFVLFDTRIIGTGTIDQIA